MKWFSMCGAFVLAAALAPAAQQSPAGGPGTATPQPEATPPARTDAPATGTARIGGRVVRADTGAPLPGARVRLSGQRFGRMAVADGEGRYEFADLPEGRYSLQATHSGYVTLDYGQRRAFEPGRPIAIADAEVLNRVDFPLPLGSVITGVVTDEFGEPVTGAEVRVERHQWGPGGRQLSTFNTGAALAPFQMRTNDLGEFRVWGLIPGEYVVSARLPVWGTNSLTQGPPTPDAPAAAFLPTYYPGTVEAAAAQAIRVGVAQTAAAHFAMVPGRMVRISGTVHDSQGRPAAGMRVALQTATATSSSRTGGGPVEADGSFSIGNVAPGTYTLIVLAAAPALGAETVSLAISVSTEDLTGLRLTTRPGTTIRGRVEWEGGAPRPAGSLRVNSISAEPRTGPLGETTMPRARAAPRPPRCGSRPSIRTRGPSCSARPPSWIRAPTASCCPTPRSAWAACWGVCCSPPRACRSSGR